MKLRFRKALLLLGGVGMLWQPSVAIADKGSGPVVFLPSSKWVLDYAEHSCSLAREFSNGGEKFYLRIRQTEPNNFFALTLLSNKSRYRERGLRFRFTPHENAIEDDLVFPLTADGGFSGVLVNSEFGPARKAQDGSAGSQIPETEIADWATRVDGIEIDKGFRKPIRLETGSLGEVRQAMSACLDELVTHWGINVAAHKSLTREVEPKDILDWAKKVQAAYPAEALRKGSQGPVKIRLIVDKNGTPTDCRVLTSLTEPILREQTCVALMKYAKFFPALDAKRNPIDSYYMTTVSYRIK